MTNILTPTYPERRGENETDRYEAEAAQTILGPVPLSVAIATTLKQLREECADLFDGDELPDTKAPKITLPGASSEAPDGAPAGAGSERRTRSEYCPCPGRGMHPRLLWPHLLRAGLRT